MTKKNVDTAIESILNQSYKNFEFLIIDDCSVDSTFEKLENYKDLDSRVKIFKKLYKYWFNKVTKSTFKKHVYRAHCKTRFR